ncbi:hypothetical protein HG536_0D03050 [Torulaspora globosa]|uniref:Factor arrest protein 11 n=1 Tax=Torulaspora globosa TaxID=48254 RepID=A0A7G3ZGZ7_9SACH|nr:uncharacterized protein HG536_0D03050 [Torulaspora globosa]QLL32783.1 hypothetical protein HG536_0D03050 [Torulaspora globosa]
MVEKERTELPSRSVSLGNLRPKSNLKKNLNFFDDTSTRAHTVSSGSIELNKSADERKHDLNNMLYFKASIAEGMLNSQRIKRKAAAGRGQESFRMRSGIEGNVTTVACDSEEDDEVKNEDSNEFDENRELQEGDRQGDVDEDFRLGEIAEGEDDEEFANVDEIDGPISAKGNEGLNGTMSEIDYNMPVDAEFQRSLDERAAEIDKSSTFRPISIPKVEWSLQDFNGLYIDLADWFCASDFTFFPALQAEFDKKVPESGRFLTDSKFASTVISRLVKDALVNPASGLLVLTYVSLGTFASSDSLDRHTEHIRRNNLLLCSEVPNLVELFKIIAINCRDDSENLKESTMLLFYSSTILYFISSVCIDLREENLREIQETIESLEKADILQFLTRYIEHWRWNSRLSMRIRNIINLLYKLLVLQFGDRNLHKRTKEYICELHGIKRSNNSSTKQCTISPLHYQAFREDITARFPDYVTPTGGLPADGDNSNSLSQFLEIPRSKVKNPMNLSLAVPEQHLATPAPSPPGSPSTVQANTNFRTRKSFQTNMAYPCLYPSDDEDGKDDLSERIELNGSSDNSEVIVPYSIQEASKILSENVDIKLSVKQLWHERELFMMTERGWKVDLTIDPFKYSVGKQGIKEPIEIMNRIESYYANCLPSLNSLVFVLLQTVESNLTNINYRRADFADDTKISSLMPRLEINRTKEISMRSSLGIIFLLLKWFKLSHILKFEHFAVLLNDSRYVQICTSVLSKNAEDYTDCIYNRMLGPSAGFWKYCSNFNDSYRDAYSCNATDYNTVMLSSFSYMLKILRKVIGSKTERLKELPLSVGALFKKFYRVFNLDIYHPILRIVKELTPFKNKRWKSEHMELISGVFLYERLELVDNWVTGKDISGELSDACGQEIALRALLQFYNFLHYEKAMGDLGYSQRNSANTSLLNREAEYIGM